MPSTPIQAFDERVMPFAVEQIWAVLTDAKSYPNWYPSVVKVRVLEETTALVGTKFEIHPRHGRAFPCCVESVDESRQMRMRYPGDFIVGTGEWRLEAINGGRTRATYLIDVVATGWLAAILGSVLPFAKIHSKSMQEVLAKLEAEVRRRAS